MDDEITVDYIRFVDAFSVPEIAAALKSLRWTDKSRDMVTALASAPNRALSRIEMARAVGSENVNSTNSVLGTFCRTLAMTLDPTLAAEWRPALSRCAACPGQVSPGIRCLPRFATGLAAPALRPNRP